MTGFFHLNRHHSRWTLYSLLGAGVLLSNVPSWSPKLPSDSLLSDIHLSSPVMEQSHPAPSQTLPQVDDVFHQGQGSGFQVVATTTRPQTSNWPPMSPDQLEQARRTLIRDGLSPMQADMVLSLTSAP